MTIKMGLFDFFSKKIKCTIDEQEFQSLLKEKPKPMIVDVRSRIAFDEEKLPNAIHLDFHHPNFNEVVGKWDRKKKYLVYCHMGRRSKKACKKMMKVGLKKVYNLKGGIVNYSGRII